MYSMAGLTAVAMSAATDLAVHPDHVSPSVAQGKDRREPVQCSADEGAERALSKANVDGLPAQNAAP
jgi:hypothetical protein